MLEECVKTRIKAMGLEDEGDLTESEMVTLSENVIRDAFQDDAPLNIKARARNEIIGAIRNKRFACLTRRFPVLLDLHDDDPRLDALMLNNPRLRRALCSNPIGEQP